MHIVQVSGPVTRWILLMPNEITQLASEMFHSWKRDCRIADRLFCHRVSRHTL